MNLAILLALAAHAAPEELVLVKNFGTQYVIMYADDAIEPERTAAEELRYYIGVVAFVDLAVVPESQVPATSRCLSVGQTRRFREAFPDIDPAAIESDAIVLKTAGGDVFLAGGRPRGTLYAVYTFLEDVVGCRWWTATEESVPRKPVLTIAPLDIAYAPKIRCREAFYRGAFDGIFAARCKCNGHHERIPEAYGGHYRILGWCHTFYQLLPPDKYFAEHPEWYSEIGGKRVSEGAQLCLESAEMRAELTKNALEWIRKDPQAGIISVSQNDCGGRCECPACKAVEAEEGSPSGAIVRFVNAVAEEIEKEFPNVWVETLAYSYTRQAPKLAKPRGNVLIRLCTIECAFAQPLAAGDQNETFRRDIEQWSAIAPHLYVWDYVTNFRHYLLPHPNLRVLAPNIRFFADHNAIGLFEQGDAGSTCGDFVELRAWLLAHLMWDPSRDADALIREFLDGYYGSAGAPLQEYLKVVHDAVERSGAYLPCYLEDTVAWFALEDMNRATDLFDQAQAAVAGDATLSARVRRARLPLDHAWLQRYASLKRAAAGANAPFRGPEDPVAACEDFIRTANGFNVGQYAEGRPFADYEPLLRGRFRPPAPAPAECQGLPETDWIDVQDCEFSLHGLGNWSNIADDPAASDGKAARMPATHTQWAVQLPITTDVAALGKVHAYAIVRCDAKAVAGPISPSDRPAEDATGPMEKSDLQVPAFQIGIYDAAAKTNLIVLNVSLADVADKAYRTFDLGTHALPESAYFWVAPAANPDAVEAVYVDRIFFVRAP